MEPVPFFPAQPPFDRLAAGMPRGDAAFIHQHVVDPWAAHTAGTGTRPIGLTFALVGLYLLAEHGWTGRRVQLAHMKLARQKHEWPAFVLPEDRGAMTALDVMGAPEGPERDRAIHGWSRSVWAAFSENRATVAELLKQHGII